MIGLALVIRDHAQAFEYDLMTRTGRTLAECAEARGGMAALCSFLRYLPPDSATYRETHPKDETGAWMGAAKTNAILADIYDMYAVTHAKKGRRPKPYPRPNASARSSIGAGAIPVREFEAWWKSGR